MAGLPSPSNKPSFTDSATEQILSEISVPARAAQPAEVLENNFEEIELAPPGEEIGPILAPKRFRIEGLKESNLKEIDLTLDEIKDSLEIYKEESEKIKVTLLDETSAQILKTELIALARKYPNLEIRAKNGAIPVFTKQ